MFRIFRQFRKSILSKLFGSKGRMYLLYALGEIFLVVIGILIALQVNNWNESRKMMKSAYNIHEELRYEFQNNRSVLKERIEYLEQANSYVRNILNLINKSDSELRKINLDSILNASLKYGNYNPANSTINELVSSGKLNLILDRGLKENLFKWLQLIEDADEDFKNQDQQATTLLIPYLYKHISFRNLKALDSLEIDGNSELFDNNYRQVFSDLEFENLYHGKLFWNTTMIKHYRDLDILAATIIEQTKIEDLGL